MIIYSYIDLHIYIVLYMVIYNYICNQIIKFDPINFVWQEIIAFQKAIK